MAVTGKHSRSVRHDGTASAGAIHRCLQFLIGSQGFCDENILKRNYGTFLRVKGRTANMVKPVGGMIAFWTKAALDIPVVPGVGNRRFLAAENMAQFLLWRNLAQGIMLKNIDEKDKGSFAV